MHRVGFGIVSHLGHRIAPIPGKVSGSAMMVVAAREAVLVMA
jgi:hypothetical protein